jgi:hypothetical protein
MQISKMTVGTMYLVNRRQNWKTDTYYNEAYILMSLDPYAASNTSSWRPVYSTVILNGTDYSYTGKKWAPHLGAGAKLYLMQRMNPDTREPMLNPRDGRPFLSLISSRQVRGEWAETSALQIKAEGEEQKRREQQRAVELSRWNRAQVLAIRLRNLLGLGSNSYTVDTAGVTPGGGPTAIKINLIQAEALADRLDEANQEIEDLKAELRELRS